ASFHKKLRGNDMLLPDPHPLRGFSDLGQSYRLLFPALLECNRVWRSLLLSLCQCRVTPTLVLLCTYEQHFLDICLLPTVPALTYLTVCGCSVKWQPPRTTLLVCRSEMSSIRTSPSTSTLVRVTPFECRCNKVQSALLRMRIFDSSNGFHLNRRRSSLCCRGRRLQSHQSQRSRRCRRALSLWN
ncbi:hypothetical protein LTR40_010179, partial [Exophiala xenobiotica]